MATVVQLPIRSVITPERPRAAAPISARRTGTSPAVRADLRLGRLESPLGPLVAGAGDEGIAFLRFADETYTADDDRLRPITPGHDGFLERLALELAEYFAGNRRQFTVPLAPGGTAFQRRVWTALADIPHGETRSYAELAAAVGQPRAMRAVGRANACNPLLIVLPSHRVINRNGDIGGYAGGRHRKQYLLDLERRA
jgi:O-6-methylguanine DNA methyltransferase